ncbi:anthranilate synthase alpha subunit 2, chloroplastic-like [Dorcoceras hygrometricum]|uniref:Anthranilate synthase alpha subunit 2, chloroplastic-like n=1 Tax=Dorcoceras hygrometricum TaxID=472368 RepID=A0A2Z7APM8_9LAMI|nr:anthranilate synthase alpha subunit 2, chloroplastic-like [Dorcoceras hygrometricum]
MKMELKGCKVLVSKMQDVDPWLHLERNMTNEEYMKAVLQAKEHISAGDIF